MNKPWNLIFSIVIIILSLFIIAFLKMELRRVHYSVIRLNRQNQVFLDRYNKNLMKYLELTRGSRLDQLAKSKLTLEETKKGQVILLINDRVAISQ